jgi:nucleoside-diphosphate-sugar epimerase
LQYAPFADEALIADYAKAAAETLYSGSVITGRPGNLFDPRGNATRAEVAAMMHRFAEAAGL